MACPYGRLGCFYTAMIANGTADCSNVDSSVACKYRHRHSKSRSLLNTIAGLNHVEPKNNIGCSNKHYKFPQTIEIQIVMTVVY